MNIFCVGQVIISAIFKGLAAEGVSVFDFAVLRALAGLICISFVCWYNKSLPWVAMPKRHYVKMATRSCLGTWNFITVYWVVTIMPLSLQMIIFQTQPFWASILAVIFLAESIMLIEYLGMAVCFAGVMFIAFYKGDSSQVDTGSNRILLGVLLSFGTAWAESFINLFNRMMADVDWYIVCFWHSAIGLISPLIVIAIEALIQGEIRIVVAYDSRQWGLLVLASFLDFVILSASIIAAQACSLTFISLIMYLLVFYAFLVDILYFHESFTLI